MRSPRILPVTPLCMGLALLLSCSETGPKTYQVSGRVTWNGEPLPDGDIIFAAADGSPIEDYGSIAAGGYRFRAKPGKKLVRIRATRRVGPIDPVMGEAKREEYIPERYNTKTELPIIDVTPDGKNQFDFALTSKP